MADDIETPDEIVLGDVIDNAPDEVNEGDTVVIVESPEPESAPEGDAVDAVVIETTIDQAERITALEARIAAVEETAFIASIDADIALDAVEDLREADEAIVEATDEAIVETIEGAEIEDNLIGDDQITTDDVAPVSAKVHPLFRSWSDWKNK